MLVGQHPAGMLLGADLSKGGAFVTIWNDLGESRLADHISYIAISITYEFTLSFRLARQWAGATAAGPSYRDLAANRENRTEFVGVFAQGRQPIR